MQLVFDVGNSRIKAALFRDEQPVRSTSFEYDEVKEDAALIRKLEAFVGGEELHRAAIASVVPEMIRRLATLPMIPSGEPFVVSADVILPFRLAYETPQTLGSDRIAAAAAAWVRFGRPARRAVVTVDAGTATTYEVVSGEGVFLGGAIAPGPRLMSTALGTATAQLPDVDVDAAIPVVGRSTREAIQAGVLYGFFDAVGGMVRRVAATLDEEPIIILTGGWSPLLSSNLDIPHEHDPELVLRGIDILMRLNA